MTTKEIRSTGVRLTRLGLGTVPLAGFGGHHTDYETFEKVILAGFDAGIRYFDTAPMYGMGRAEHFLGHVIRTRGLRDKVAISTKVGRILKPIKAGATTGESQLFGISWADALPFTEHYDYTYDGIWRSFEDSQMRFGLDRFDILHVHDIGKLTHGDQADVYWRQLGEGGYRALDEIRSAKGANAISIGVNEIEAVERMAAEFDLDACLLAGRYSLLNHAPLDGFYPNMQKRGIAVIAAGVFNSGILGGGSKGATKTFDYMQAPTEIIEKVQSIEAICDRYGVALPEAAIQFVSAHPAVTCILQGCKNVQEVAQNTAALDRAIPSTFWGELKSAGILPAHAPVPQGA